MTTRRDVERALRAFRVPASHAEHARRVLDAARTRLSTVERPSGLERMWASRTLRWAWAVCAGLALLAGTASDRLAERSLAHALGPRPTGTLEVPAPEALGLDASWATRLAWAARAEARSRPGDALRRVIEPNIEE